MKALKKTLIALLLVAILLPVAAAVALYFPKVQTFAVHKVTGYLSKNIDGDISVGSVNIIPFNTAVIGDFCVREPSGDTILFTDKLKATLDGKTLLKSEELRVNSISLNGGKASIRYVAPGETNVSRLLAQFSSDREKKTDLPWSSIRLDHIMLSGIDFVLDNPYAEGSTTDGSIDFNHLNVSGLELKAKSLSWSAEKQAVRARLQKLSFVEKNSGMHLDKLSANFSADKESVKVKDLHFSDSLSELTADCEMTTSDFLDFNAIMDNLPLSLRLKESTVDLATISRFVPALAGKDLKLKVAGRFSGSLNNITAKGLKLESEGGATSMDIDARITGLPDPDCTTADITLRDSHSTTSDIVRIIKSFNSDFKESSISRYAPGETIRLNGKVKGPLSDFLADIKVETDHSGRLDAEVNFKGITSSSPRFDGRISGNSLALGKALGMNNIGTLSFNGIMDVTAGKQLNANIQELNINRLGFNGYEYGGITVSGTLQDHCINAYITASDPNLKLKGDIFADLSGRESKYYRADIDLTQADLSALHFDKRDTSLIRGSINADIEQRDGSVFLGRAELGDLRVRLSEGKLDLGDIAIDAFFDGDGEYNIDLNSAMAEANYKGSSSIKELVADAKALLGREMGNLLAIDGEVENEFESSRGCTFSLKTGDIKPLASFVMPDLFISEGTTVTAEMDGSTSLKIDARSSLIQIKDNYIRNLSLKADGDKGPIRADISADAIQSGQFILRNNKVSAELENNNVDLKLTFDNGSRENRKGNFNASILFPGRNESSDMLIADIEPSDITIEGSHWELAPATVRYRNKHIAVEDFKAFNGDQFLTANGSVSESREDTLNVKLNKFDLDFLNDFLSSDLNVQGVFTGSAAGFGLLGKNIGLITDIKGDSLAVNGEELGQLQLLCKWDEDKERFNLLVDNKLNGRKPINAIAWYKPSDKKARITASIDSLAVCWLDPLLEGIVSDMGGSISGIINAEGPLDKLSISANGTRFNDLACKVDFTNVPYVISGPFSIDDNGITFDNDTIADTAGNLGRVNGGVSYDHFKDIRLGVRFRLLNMMAINTNDAFEENGFYGRAFGTGSVNIDGPLDNIRMSINLRTGDGSVHIPLNSSGSEKTSILTFVDNSLPIYDELDSLMADMRHKKEEQKHSSLGVNIKLNITQSTEVGLDINRSLGDMLKARGTGNVEINAGGDIFDIKGGYNVDEGSYKLALMGITSKDFIINPGGTINFTGDIMQSDLNLKATYRTKASIGQLIADSTSVSTRRTVNCGIGITGKLSNPQLGFNIDIPDLDPATQSRVEAAFSSEDKRLKQFLALLVSGSFVPDEQSGIVNNTTVLYSNASEIMANQVNNIFRQLDIPLDLGFNYQPGSGGVDIFDVAISTQLFNNRVTINGNIGNQDYLTTSSNSEVVGNVDMEVKLDNSGRLRLNLFSHAADRYSNYLDQTQRNGAGIVYQEEFDTFKEFWSKLFRRTHSLIPGVTLPAPPLYPAPSPDTGGRRPSMPLRDSSNTISIKPAR